MATARWQHTATALPDGRVLIAGGYGRSTVLASAELYDPATGSFSPTGSMATARRADTATLLADGRVLIAGGDQNPYSSTYTFFASAELYDPATGSFSPTGSMTTTRAGNTATLLADGRVLIAGGIGAELYDPKKGSFSPTGSMTTAHWGQTATLLSDGRILIAGGNDQSTVLTSAELYDPATSSFSPTGSMATPRGYHTTTLLPDGRVLIAGGLAEQVSMGLASAEVYQP